MDQFDDWTNAVKKVNHYESKNLTVQDIESALLQNEANDTYAFTDGERNALLQIKANADDLAQLDGSGAEDGIEPEDFRLFSDLYRNTARDINNYEGARNFMVENKTTLDTNKNGILSLSEIQSARQIPSLSDRDKEYVNYLSDRYSRTLRYSSSTSDLSVSEANVPEADFKSGGLSNVVDATQSAVYAHRKYDNQLTSAYFGGAVLGLTFALHARASFLTAAASSILGSGLSGLALRPFSNWAGQSQQDSQEQRIHRLMTTVGNLKY